MAIFIKKEVFIDAEKFSVVDQSNLPAWMVAMYDNKESEWTLEDTAGKKEKVMDSDWVLYDKKAQTIMRVETEVVFLLGLYEPYEAYIPPVVEEILATVSAHQEIIEVVVPDLEETKEKVKKVDVIDTEVVTLKNKVDEIDVGVVALKESTDHLYDVAVGLDTDVAHLKGRADEIEQVAEGIDVKVTTVKGQADQLETITRDLTDLTNDVGQYGIATRDDVDKIKEKLDAPYYKRRVKSK